MEEVQHYKFCPACGSKNSPQDVVCSTCFSDISSVEPLTQDEYNTKKIEKENVNKAEPGETEKLFADFKSAYGTTDKSKASLNKSSYRLYERTKEDEEAEKILKELKESADKFKDASIRKTKEIFETTKDKASDLFKDVSAKINKK